MNARGAARRAGSLAAAALAAACVTGSYSRERFNEPVPPERLAALAPGVDTLASCLAALGAPNRVFEYRVGPDRGSGAALLWYWRDEPGWGLTVSVPIRQASARLTIDRLSAELPACVLWFDERLVLERWREGRIGELIPGRLRPAPVLDDPPAAR